MKRRAYIKVVKVALFLLNIEREIVADSVFHKLHFLTLLRNRLSAYVQSAFEREPNVWVRLVLRNELPYIVAALVRINLMALANTGV